MHKFQCGQQKSLSFCPQPPFQQSSLVVHASLQHPFLVFPDGEGAGFDGEGPGCGLGAGFGPLLTGDALAPLKPLQAPHVKGQFPLTVSPKLLWVQ
jgi:hypothetical protein